jgi:hypothetical protein
MWYLNQKLPPTSVVPVSGVEKQVDTRKTSKMGIKNAYFMLSTLLLEDKTPTDLPDFDSHLLRQMRIGARINLTTH